MKKLNDVAIVCALGLIQLFLGSANAAVQSKKVEYKSGDAVMEGVLYYDDAKTGKRPGVLVVHDWMGLAQFSEGRARELAQQGFVAFAADIYGKGVRPANMDEAAKIAGQYKSGERANLRAHAQAALNVLMQDRHVDASHLGAIGYCFGGTTVLELARSGAPVVATVSFHGGLQTPHPSDAKNIKGHVLVLHGADDPFVKPDEVKDFEEEMRDGHVDWELVKYSGSVHGFTNPAAGNDNSKGMAYNAEAEKRSWIAMKDFFSEYLKK